MHSLGYNNAVHSGLSCFKRTTTISHDKLTVSSKKQLQGPSNERTVPGTRIYSAMKQTQRMELNAVVNRALAKGCLSLLVIAVCLVGVIALPQSLLDSHIPAETASQSKKKDGFRSEKKLLSEAPALQSPLLDRVKILKIYPHESDAFTQGLVYYGNGTFYESTGLYGESTVREVDLDSGKVRNEWKNSNAVFGEGLALWKNKLLQVSWKTQKGFIYDRETLKQVGTFTHPMKDGWGLTNSGSLLFGSDGSSTLYFINPKNFKELGRRTVTDGGRAVKHLNELEYINGHVWANVWLTDCIAVISPKSGRVVKWIYLPELRQRAESASLTMQDDIDVLNGIAWDNKRKRLFVTGKFWPHLYEIKAVRVKNPPASYLQDIRDKCIL